MMEPIRISETSVYFYKTTGRYIPEGCHIHTRRRENVICHFSQCLPSEWYTKFSLYHSGHHNFCIPSEMLELGPEQWRCERKQGSSKESCDV
jgi:hypothetical protein